MFADVPSVESVDGSEAAGGYVRLLSLYSAG